MKYYTTKEAAEYLKVSPWTIRQWYRNGLLKGMKPNNKNILFEEKELDALAKKGNRGWLSRILDAKNRTHINAKTERNN